MTLPSWAVLPVNMGTRATLPALRAASGSCSSVMLSFTGEKFRFECSIMDTIVFALAARTHLSTFAWVEQFNCLANASHATVPLVTLS